MSHAKVTTIYHALLARLTAATAAGQSLAGYRVVETIADLNAATDRTIFVRPTANDNEVQTVRMLEVRVIVVAKKHGGDPSYYTRAMDAAELVRDVLNPDGVQAMRAAAGSSVSIGAVDRTAVMFLESPAQEAGGMAGGQFEVNVSYSQ